MVLNHVRSRRDLLGPFSVDSHRMDHGTAPIGTETQPPDTGPSVLAENWGRGLDPPNGSCLAEDAALFHGNTRRKTRIANDRKLALSHLAVSYEYS